MVEDEPSKFIELSSPPANDCLSFLARSTLFWVPDRKHIIYPHGCGTWKYFLMKGKLVFRVASVFSRGDAIRSASIIVAWRRGESSRRDGAAVDVAIARPWTPTLRPWRGRLVLDVRPWDASNHGASHCDPNDGLHGFHFTRVIKWSQGRATNFTFDSLRLVAVRQNGN